ncbi:MAG TPA: DMT family transporter [Devosiaceae bacterium]|nr:DMT family transporter [Devosiaceae bacterium]
MPLGVFFALLSYSIYSCGDAITKSFSGQLGVFEIGFVANLFALVPAMLAKRPHEKWRCAFQLASPWLLHVRGVMAVASSISIVYAFVTIPLAEAYAIAFTTPLFLSLLSVLVLKERISPSRWLLVGLSFVGVMIVVRPGFRELQPGHLAALFSAATSAASTTLLRMVSGKESRLSIIAMNGAYQLGGNGIFLLFTFSMLGWFDLLRLAAIGLFGGVAQLLVIAALQRAPASHVAPAQYVQILWAVSFGSLFYAEFPDSIGICGLVVVTLAGLATIFADGARTRVAGRWSEFRARRGGPKFTEVEGPEI